MSTITRPYPPKSVLGEVPERDFVPAMEIEQWYRDALIDPEGALYNMEHEHLSEARIGCLWTAIDLRKNQKEIAGLTEIPAQGGNAWAKGRIEMQLRDWFGFVPDFLITFHAGYAKSISDAEWCALAEHELYHCGQKLDKYGMPKFDQEGNPEFGIRGHDVEEFTGIVRRYGVGATNAAVREFVEAANRPPEIASVDIASMCGTCLRKVA